MVAVRDDQALSTRRPGTDDLDDLIVLANEFVGLRGTRATINEGSRSGRWWIGLSRVAAETSSPSGSFT